MAPPMNERQHLATLYAIIQFHGTPKGQDWVGIARILPGDLNSETVRSRFRRFQAYAEKELLLKQVEAPERDTPIGVKKAAAKISTKRTGMAKMTMNSKPIEESDEDETAGNAISWFHHVDSNGEDDDDDDGNETLVESRRSSPTPAPAPKKQTQRKPARPRAASISTPAAGRKTKGQTWTPVAHGKVQAEDESDEDYVP